MQKKMKKIEKKDLELIQGVVKAKLELELASKNFELAKETELIDYYAYQIKAVKSKIDYLIKKIKQKGIVLDTIEAYTSFVNVI